MHCRIKATLDAVLMVVVGSDTLCRALAVLFRFITVSEVVQNRLCAEIHTSSDIDTSALPRWLCATVTQLVTFPKVIVFFSLKLRTSLGFMPEC